MPTFEERLQSLCSAYSPTRCLPGVVLLANDNNGERVYHQAVGTSSLEPDKSKPLTEDTIFWIASCTKLLTSISALQLVERDFLSLDEPIGNICPEIASPDILQGFDSNGKPMVRKATKPITLRHLLTHTSGMAYDFLSPDVMKWWASTGQNPYEYADDITQLYSAPLLFEPGTQWIYSPGLDWAGIAIARVTGETSLGTYMRKNIFNPLGIKDAAFRASDFSIDPSEFESRYASLTLRKQNAKREITAADPIRGVEPKADLGGGGLMTSPKEYIKILTSLLRNDGKLLKPETVQKYLLEPQLVDGKVSESARKSLLRFTVAAEGGRMLTGGLPLPTPDHPNGKGGDIEYQHGLLGLLNRKTGGDQWTLSWSGFPNLFWWVSPKEGLCGMYASQLIPPGDTESMDLEVAWREEMERKYGKSGVQKARL